MIIPASTGMTLAGDRVGVVARQEHRRTGDLLRLERPPQPEAIVNIPSICSGTCFFMASVIVIPGVVQVGHADSGPFLSEAHRVCAPDALSAPRDDRDLSSSRPITTPPGAS
jgi:hypothetical protein